MVLEFVGLDEVVPRRGPPTGLLAVVCLIDDVQVRHGVLRNDPLVGDLRCPLEGVGPELQTYVVQPAKVRSIATTTGVSAARATSTQCGHASTMVGRSRSSVDDRTGHPAGYGARG